jgi:pimeloyl-ACP methyl ester carboxylesterase
MAVDLDRLSAFNRPALLSKGNLSPPFFSVIVEKVAAALPQAQPHTFDGAGHVPHLTHADDYVRIVSGFIQRRSSGR